MNVTSPTPSGFYGRVAKCLLAFAGAGLLYVALPAVLDLPNAPGLAKHEFAAPTDWGMTPEAARKHPYLARLALQASAADYVLKNGRALDESFGDSWQMPEALVDAVTASRAGTSSFLVTQCDGPRRLTSVMAWEAQPGFTGEAAVRSTTALRRGISLFEREGKVHAEIATTAPWWHIPTFAVLRGSPDHRADIARTYPELDTDCTAAISPTASLADVLGRFPDLAGLKSWDDPTFQPPAHLKLNALGAGDAMVVRLLHGSPGAQVSLVTVTQDAKEEQALESAFNTLRAQLSSVQTARHVGHQHRDTERSTYLNYGLKDGFVEVAFARRQAGAQLQLTWSKDTQKPTGASH